MCGAAPGLPAVARATRAPIRVLEVGASAGLNLRWDRYRYERRPRRSGRSTPRCASVRRSAAAALRVVERRGCDAAPIDPGGRGRPRDAGLSVARPARAAGVRRRAHGPAAAGGPRTHANGSVPSARVSDGVTTVVVHSISCNISTRPRGSRLLALLAKAGAGATPAAPLAWLRMEPPPPASPERALAELRLTTWPGATGERGARTRRRPLRRAGAARYPPDVSSAPWPSRLHVTRSRANPGGMDVTKVLGTDTQPFRGRKPPWFKVQAPGGRKYRELSRMIRDEELHTVCQEAACPNVGDCWERGTATFMILGDTCTRRCGFCNVKTGKPTWNDPLEPLRVARSVARMGLRHAVITSVDRDDLPDYGSGVWVGVIRSIRMQAPWCKVECLTPDFRGEEMPLAKVIAERPDVFNHNVEVVPLADPVARRGSRWERSLRVLANAKAMGGDEVVTKSGLMVGLGETHDELVGRSRRCASTTSRCSRWASIYATERHLPVVRYWHPDEFKALEQPPTSWASPTSRPGRSCVELSRRPTRPAGPAGHRPARRRPRLTAALQARSQYCAISAQRRTVRLMTLARRGLAGIAVAARAADPRARPRPRRPGVRPALQHEHAGRHRDRGQLDRVLSRRAGRLRERPQRRRRRDLGQQQQPADDDLGRRRRRPGDVRLELRRADAASWSERAVRRPLLRGSARPPGTGGSPAPNPGARNTVLLQGARAMRTIAR